jgi:hypothetical protein
MPIFCPSCGTLYGGWEMCPECNADNPYLDRRDDPAHMPVMPERIGEGESSGEDGANVPTLKVLPYFSGV